MSNLSANWNYPNSILAGSGRISELAETCKNLNINQKTQHVLSDYLYFRFNYVNVALRRNFESFLTDFRFSKYPRYPEAEDTLNNFTSSLSIST